MREKENRAAARVSLTGARRRAQWKNPEVGRQGQMSGKSSPPGWLPALDGGGHE